MNCRQFRCERVQISADVVVNVVVVVAAVVVVAISAL